MAKATETTAAETERTHGGSRPGSGRPPRYGSRMVPGICFACPAHLLEGVEALAVTHGLSRSEAIVHCLAETLAS